MVYKIENKNLFKKLTKNNYQLKLNFSIKIYVNKKKVNDDEWVQSFKKDKA